MTIDTIIKDCEQGIKQCELFIKAHQKNMEIGEIKEYQYYIERYKLTIDTMNKYRKIQEIVEHWACCGNPLDSMTAISEVLEDGNDI